MKEGARASEQAPSPKARHPKKVGIQALHKPEATDADPGSPTLPTLQLRRKEKPRSAQKVPHPLCSAARASGGGSGGMRDPVTHHVQTGATTSLFWAFSVRVWTLGSRSTWGFAPPGEGGHGFL